MKKDRLWLVGLFASFAVASAVPAKALPGC